MGHLKRCLSIAQELKRLHHNVEFVVDNVVESKDPIRKGGFVLRKSADLQYDMILVDRYDVHNDMLAMHKRKCRLLARIDDAFPHLLNDRISDVIINGNSYANKKLYRNIARKGLHLLLGSRFIPMDRKMCFARRKYQVRRNVKNITVTFGGADTNYTSRICKKVAALDLNANIIVPNGARLEHKLAIYSSKLDLLPFVDNMHDILQKSDIIICSSSSTYWQSAAVGVPCIAFQTADNQLNIFQYIKRTRLGIALPENSINDGILDKAITQLDYGRRRALSVAMRKTVDCRGSERIATYLHKLVAHIS